MKREPYLLRLPENLKTALKSIAKQRGVTINGLIVDWLWRALEEYGKTEQASNQSSA
jgi:hypothetical protein